jgi:hypothetical protein
MVLGSNIKWLSFANSWMHEFGVTKIVLEILVTLAMNFISLVMLIVSILHYGGNDGFIT